ncbi:MAG: hypothetical protein WA782_12790 [Sulfitobacter sp.]
MAAQHDSLYDHINITARARDQKVSTMYMDERFRPRLQALSYAVMNGDPPFEKMVPEQVENALVRIAEATGKPLSVLRERYFFSKHGFFEKFDETKPGFHMPYIELNNVIQQILDVDVPIMSVYDTWKPTMKAMRTAMQEAAQTYGVTLDMSFTSRSQFAAKLGSPYEGEAPYVEFYARLRPGMTYIQIFLFLPGKHAGSFRLTALFGDLRSPSLNSDKDVINWSNDCARYAAAVFKWWADYDATV